MNKKYIFLSMLGVGSLVSCGCSSPWRPELESFIFKMKYQDAVTYVDKALLEATSLTVDGEGNELQSRKTLFYFEQEPSKPYFYHLIERINEPNVTYHYLNRKMYKNLEDNNYYSKEIKDDKVNDTITSEDYILSHIANFYATSDDNGFKGGGMYKGDDLKTSAHLQFYMYIDEENNQLVYQYIDQQVSENIISNMLYKVNSYGLLESYDLENKIPNEKISTLKISIKYNENANYDENNFKLE